VEQRRLAVVVSVDFRDRNRPVLSTGMYTSLFRQAAAEKNNKSQKQNKTKQQKANSN